MKFYDRKKEMAILYAAKKQSQTSACFTVMTVRQRPNSNRNLFAAGLTSDSH